MDKFRNAAADILANITLVLFIVCLLILAIPFGLLFVIIGWLSTNPDLEGSEFDKRIQAVHSTIAKMMKVKE
ncbi:putative membrane protein [Escherichia phage PSD2001]|nr:putative membrane protein [Escherichia phage PSD2001]